MRYARTVDDFVAAESLNLNKRQQASTRPQQQLEKEGLRYEQFPSSLKSALGAGGRAFESPRPDHLLNRSLSRRVRQEAQTRLRRDLHLERRRGPRVGQHRLQEESSRGRQVFGHSPVANKTVKITDEYEHRIRTM
jgi:hypothetical protein